MIAIFEGGLIKMTSNIGWSFGSEKPPLQTRKRQRVGGCNRTFWCSGGKRKALLPGLCKLNT
ncbi:MAG: hypothetical protein C0422_12140 [Alcaligenaceae bacterium]|nr:hypothetical protein [Alcaligenaceae bacterium]